MPGPTLRPEEFKKHRNDVAIIFKPAHDFTVSRETVATEVNLPIDPVTHNSRHPIAPPDWHTPVEGAVIATSIPTGIFTGAEIPSSITKGLPRTALTSPP